MIVPAGFLQVSMEILPAIILETDQPNHANIQLGKLISYAESKINVIGLVYIWKLGLGLFPPYVALMSVTNFVIFTILSHHIVAWQEFMREAIENIHFRSKRNVSKKIWPSDTCRGVCYN